MRHSRILSILDTSSRNPLQIRQFWWSYTSPSILDRTNCDTEGINWPIRKRWIYNRSKIGKNDFNRPQAFYRTVPVRFIKLVARLAEVFDAVGALESGSVRTMTYYHEYESKEVHREQMLDIEDELEAQIIQRIRGALGHSLLTR